MLGFSLETESVKALQDRLTAGTLTSETLTKAYLARIALTNAEGPALQAVRSVNPARSAEATALDPSARRAAAARPAARHPGAARRHDRRRRAADHGRLDRAAEVGADGGRHAGRQAQGGGRDHPRQDQRRPSSTALFDANMPEGYSSLGGQVLLPSDTDKTPAGSSAGSAGCDGGRPGGADDRPGDLDRHGAAHRARGCRRRRRPEADGRTRVERRACCRSRSRRTRPARSPARCATPRRALEALTGALVPAVDDRAGGQADRRHLVDARAPYPAAITTVTGARRDDA